MTTAPDAATLSADLSRERLASLVDAVRAVPLRFLLLALVSGLVVGACMVTTPWAFTLAARLGEFGSLAYAGLVLKFLAVLLAVLPVVALFRPVLATVLALTPWLVAAAYGILWPFAALMGTMAVMMCAVWRRPGRAVLPALVGLFFVGRMAWGASAMLVMDGSVVMTDGSFLTGLTVFGLYALAFLALYVVAVVTRGSARKARRLATLTARAGEVEDQAVVVAERARLARDLHDVVAHHVSLIAVRAETAPYTHPDLADDARAVLTEIATDARAALDELRGVLGVLRRSEDEAGTAAGRAPQPDLAAVADLVERARSAGADVRLDGDLLAPVSGPVGYVAYRVVQEALTNARRHAPGRPVAVAVLGEGDRLRLRVSTPYLAQTTTVDRGEPTGGRGLVGMRERVEALGGTLAAGVDGDLFVVEADLPRGAA